jgi:hypothetical protein
MYALTEQNMRPTKPINGNTMELDTVNHWLNPNESNNWSSVGSEFNAFEAFKSLEFKFRKLRFGIILYKFLFFLHNF